MAVQGVLARELRGKRGEARHAAGAQRPGAVGDRALDDVVVRGLPGGGGPALASQTLGIWVFNQAFFSGNRLPGFASAIAMVQFALVFVIAMIMQYYLRRREAVL